MALRKRNEWLEAEVSDDEDHLSDTERLEESRGATIAGRSVKRRKVDFDQEDASDEESEVVDEENDEEKADAPAHTDNDSRRNDQEIKNAASRTSPSPAEPSQGYAKKSPKTALAKEVAKASDKAHKSGVIYISRIPPFMKPHTVKNFLAPYAPSGLGRIFLTPETTEARNARIRSGGNRKQNFSDGWLEFVSKREAKVAVETLNTRTMGGKKGKYYRDDVWNLKYLRGFKWRHLTEQISNENAERAARMRAEDARERREQREYLRNVEKAKMVEGMERKRRDRLENADNGEAVDGAMEDERSAKANKRQFRQAQVLTKTGKPGEETAPSEDVKRVLSKIF
jgi:ESF2/ABP1 family protein